MRGYRKLVYEKYNSILDEDNKESSAMRVCGGASDKDFVRVDSRCLGDFYEEISRADTSYVTYVDSIKHDKSFVGRHPLEHLSAMVKFYHGRSHYPYNEEICSRLSNLFGIPTVYNRTLKHNGKACNVSVDYVSFGEDVYDTIQGSYCTDKRRKNIPDVIGLPQWHKFFMSGNLINTRTGEPIPLNVCSELFKQFIPMYMFRRHIVQDVDFDINNICVVHNPVLNTYSIGPNFDMERTFYPYFDNSYKRHYDDLYRDIKHLYVYSPSMLDDFVSKVQHIKDTKAIDIHMFDAEPSIVQRYKKYHLVKSKMDMILKVDKDFRRECSIPAHHSM